MAATVATVAYLGLEARAVEVQVQLSSGIPKFTIVGLADKAVAESRERVRAALAAIGLALPPKVITVNLSPADLPKEGSHYDLPIALVPAGGDRRDRRGSAVALCRGRRTVPRRADRGLAGRAPRRDPRVEHRQGPDLPGGAGQRGVVGRGARSHRRARPARAARASQGHRAGVRARPPPRPSRPSAGPTSPRSKARKSPSARSRSRPRAGTIC